MLRLATTVGERLTTARALEVHVAGAEANVAAALAGLGVPTRWISRLPSTTLGRRVESELRVAGVLTDAIEWGGDSRLGLFFADTGVSPRPTDVLYDRAASAFADMRELPSGAVDGARIAHLTGVTPALGNKSAGLAEAFVAAARAAGARVCFDVNHRAQLWSAQVARQRLAPLLEASDIVVCAETDARRVFELDGGVDEILTELRRDWAPRASTIVVTRGPAGCAALAANGAIHAESAREATIIDRFGMGDAFVAGLIWSLLRDDRVEVALRAAVTTAALKATVRGDILRTTELEVNRLLTEPAVEVLR